MRVEIVVQTLPYLVRGTLSTVGIGCGMRLPS